MPEKLEYRPKPPPPARHAFSAWRVVKGGALAIGLLTLLLLLYVFTEWLQRGPLKVKF